jgi:hypothetical protein
MRGIPNVGTYVDGVWQISNAGLLQRQFVELATYFCTDWIDIQAPSSVIDRTSGDPITEVITANASDGEAKGVDLEALFLATDQLSFGANLGWLDHGAFWRSAIPNFRQDIYGGGSSSAGTSRDGTLVP